MWMSGISLRGRESCACVVGKRERGEGRPFLGAKAQNPQSLLIGADDKAEDHRLSPESAIGNNLLIILNSIETRDRALVEKQRPT